MSFMLSKENLQLIISAIALLKLAGCAQASTQSLNLAKDQRSPDGNYRKITDKIDNQRYSRERF